MRVRRLPLLVALLTGCVRPLAPSRASDPSLAPALGLYELPVQVQIVLPRRAQSLPGAWDQVGLKLESVKLRAPLTQSLATGSATFQTSFAVPPGAATLSAELKQAGRTIASGSTAITLTSGLNAVAISLFAPFLTAVRPAYARPGDTVWVDGDLGTNASLNFNGTGPVTPTSAGAQRASAVVPGGAVTGQVWTSSPMASSPGLELRVPGFVPGVGYWHKFYEQDMAGLASPSLAAPRADAATVQNGRDVYVVGGMGGATLGTVERAMVQADGTLSRFGVLSSTLVSPRSRAGAFIHGRYLYVLGGLDGASPLASVERAEILADGGLGAFQLVSGVTLKTPRGAFAVTMAGRHVYVVGGSTNGTDALSTLEVADLQPDGGLADFGAAGYSMGSARRDATAHVIGPYLYALGGSGGGTPLSSIERAPLNLTTGALDANFGAVGTALPGSGLEQHASAVIGSTLYVVGGRDNANPLVQVLSSAIDAGANLGTFGFLSNLPTPRHRHGLVALGDRLYALGGATTGGLLAGIEYTSLNGSAQIAGSMGNSAFLAAGRYYGAPVVIGRRVYMIGGENAPGSVEVAMVQADGTLGDFSATGISLSTPRKGHTVAVAGNYVYLIGGMDNSTYLSSVERATIQTDGTLSNFAPYNSLNIERTYHCSAIIGNYLYVFGGWRSPDPRPQEVERAPLGPDGTLGAFVNLGNQMVGSRSNAALVVTHGRVHLLGGDATPATTERATINADGTITAFTTGSSLVQGRDGLAAVAIGERVYVIGGRNGANTAAIESAAIDSVGAFGTFATHASTLNTARRGHRCVVIGDRLYVLSGYQDGPGYLPNVEAFPLQ